MLKVKTLTTKKFLISELSLLILIIAGSWLLVFHTLSRPTDRPKLPTIDELRSANSTDAREIICRATDGQNCDVLYNLCQAESECQKYAVNKNKNNSFDYSYFQINDVHIIGRPQSHNRGTITLDCAYDLPCAAKWTNEQIKKGNGSIWVAWKSI